MNILDDDKKYLNLTNVIWEFLCPRENVGSKKIDAIFVFGGIGDEIPLHAAKLYKKGVSDKILVTGNSGKFTKNVFKDPEALVFKKIMMINGVPESDIITELNATNAGENVNFGYQKLRNTIGNIENLVLVCRSFMTKRAIATFEKQFPRVTCYGNPPKVNLIDIVNKSRYSSAKRLIAEIDRLNNYHDQGFITKVEIPKSVEVAVEKLKEVLDEIKES